MVVSSGIVCGRASSGAEPRRRVVNNRWLCVRAATGYRCHVRRRGVGRCGASAVVVMHRRRRPAPRTAIFVVVICPGHRLLVMSIPLPAVGDALVAAVRHPRGVVVGVGVTYPPSRRRGAQGEDPAGCVEHEDVARRTPVRDEALLLSWGRLVHQRRRGPVDERHGRLRGGVEQCQRSCVLRRPVPPARSRVVTASAALWNEHRHRIAKPVWEPSRRRCLAQGAPESVRCVSSARLPR